MGDNVLTDNGKMTVKLEPTPTCDTNQILPCSSFNQPKDYCQPKVSAIGKVGIIVGASSKVGSKKYGLGLLDQFQYQCRRLRSPTGDWLVLGTLIGWSLPQYSELHC